MGLMYRAVFIDWDDTIGDWGQVARKSQRELYNKYHLAEWFETPEEWFEKYNTHNTELWVRYGKNEITKDYLYLDHFLFPLCQQIGITTDMAPQRLREMAVIRVQGLPCADVQRYFAIVCVRLLPYASICIVTILFYLLRSFWASSRTGRALQIAGRNTLGIYLIHYFFLAGNWSFSRTISTNPPPRFVTDYIRLVGSCNNSLLYGGYSCDSVESAPCAIYDRG